MVSPDAAYALEYAARNINQDVAESLAIAGRNINEDVATSLHIAADSIRDSLTRIESISYNLNITAPFNESEELEGKLESSVERIKHHVDQVIRTSQVRTEVAWRPTLYAFFIGLGVGAILIGIFWAKS